MSQPSPPDYVPPRPGPATLTEDAPWPQLSSFPSFQPPHFPSFSDFLSDVEETPSWQGDTSGSAGISGYAPATPNAPATPDAPDNAYSPVEGTNDYTNRPSDSLLRPDFDQGEGAGLTLTPQMTNGHGGVPKGQGWVQGDSYTTEGGYTGEGQQGGIRGHGKGGTVTHGSSYTTVGSYDRGKQGGILPGHIGSSKGQNKGVRGSYSAGIDYEREKQQGTSLVTHVTPSRSKGERGTKSQGEDIRACGVRCLWDDLMGYLDHYSSIRGAKDTTHASLNGPLLGNGHHHHQHHSQHHQRDSNPTNSWSQRRSSTTTATNSANRLTTTTRGSQHRTSPRRRTTPLRRASEGIRTPSPSTRERNRKRSHSSSLRPPPPPALLHPGPPYSSLLA